MERERRILPKPGGALRKPKRVGRDTVPVTQWSKLDATQFGHFANSQHKAELRAARGEPEPPPPERISQVPFDHFKVDVGKAGASAATSPSAARPKVALMTDDGGRSATAVDRELPKPKRTFDAYR